MELITAKGKCCVLFKKDLARAYRQISVDPKNFNLVSFVWKKHIFCETVLNMGLRSVAYICQRVTNAISFILLPMGIAILNYLDDLAVAEQQDNATFAYNCFGTVLQKCGFVKSVDKASLPSEIMIFLGVLFNTLTMTMEITPERLTEIRHLIRTWLQKESATLKQVQSLLGKLNFIAAFVNPSRIFVSRLLIWLRSYEFDHLIPLSVKKDLIWWNRFLPLYNGISLMEYENWSKPGAIFSSDRSLTACGGFWKGCYFHAEFPESILRHEFHISALEIFSIIICLKSCAYSAKSYIEIKKNTSYSFVFHYKPQIKHFIIGTRSHGRRSPSEKIDFGRGVLGRNGFGPRSPGTGQDDVKSYPNAHKSIHLHPSIHPSVCPHVRPHK